MVWARKKRKGVINCLTKYNNLQFCGYGLTKTLLFQVYFCLFRSREIQRKTSQIILNIYLQTINLVQNSTDL